MKQWISCLGSDSVHVTARKNVIRNAQKHVVSRARVYTSKIPMEKKNMEKEKKEKKKKISVLSKLN